MPIPSYNCRQRIVRLNGENSTVAFSFSINFYHHNYIYCASAISAGISWRNNGRAANWIIAQR